MHIKKLISYMIQWLSKYCMGLIWIEQLNINAFYAFSPKPTFIIICSFLYYEVINTFMKLEPLYKTFVVRSIPSSLLT